MNRFQALERKWAKECAAEIEAFHAANQDRYGRTLAKVQVNQLCPQNCGSVLQSEPYRGPWSMSLWCPKCKQHYVPDSTKYPDYAQTGFWKSVDDFYCAQVKGFQACFFDSDRLAKYRKP